MPSAHTLLPVPPAVKSHPPSPQDSNQGRELTEREHLDILVTPQDAPGVPVPPDLIPVTSQNDPITAADTPNKETLTYEHQGHPCQNVQPSEYLQHLEQEEGITTSLPRSLFLTASLVAGPGAVESSAT
ncbi:hypothetical protein HETIRDRAFT_119083 [Heterobasidion irregulare TC 32-1]|uniref:Uncharacterized protein n=1 Tax=Heterobasidion irregulare (strain TC 32-1) TaxID=747525 RepID=W4JRH4_HETIT|nr:uncharacterized protein HETIRDRAFT_119083 [Heterobasidion irregulare TC 32-1]ETW75685.1 hypothetical protein HETIRDRAFT_119083 [Heterobasidion irregulare TC 32-1]